MVWDTGAATNPGEVEGDKIVDDEGDVVGADEIVGTEIVIGKDMEVGMVECDDEENND